MKPALSLAVVVSLIGPALPVAAQESTEMSMPFEFRLAAVQAIPGPVSAAITREAIRLAAPGKLVPSRFDAVAEARPILSDHDSYSDSQTVQSAVDNSWLQLQQLLAGEEIRIVLDDATSSRGAFRMADAESITLHVAEHDQRVPRARLRRVSVSRGTHRRRNVLLGLVIGGATGGLITALHCRGASSSCNEVAPAFVYPLAGAGTVIGALLPARAWQEIYRDDRTMP
jgi:hypothetical protein